MRLVLRAVTVGAVSTGLLLCSSAEQASGQERLGQELTSIRNMRIFQGAAVSGRTLKSVVPSAGAAQLPRQPLELPGGNLLTGKLRAPARSAPRSGLPATATLANLLQTAPLGPPTKPWAMGGTGPAGTPGSYSLPSPPSTPSWTRLEDRGLLRPFARPTTAAPGGTAPVTAAPGMAPPQQTSSRWPAVRAVEPAMDASGPTLTFPPEPAAHRPLPKKDGLLRSGEYDKATGLFRIATSPERSNLVTDLADVHSLSEQIQFQPEKLTLTPAGEIDRKIVPAVEINPQRLNKKSRLEQHDLEPVHPPPQ